MARLTPKELAETATWTSCVVVGRCASCVRGRGSVEPQMTSRWTPEEQPSGRIPAVSWRRIHGREPGMSSDAGTGTLWRDHACDERGDAGTHQ